jgi:membrane protease YdiL (CAAX protease family)
MRRPLSLADRSPFSATLVLAPIVALWHVPLIWFVPGEELAPIFLLATVAVTFFYTWLFVHTGSVLITILAHAAEGTILRDLIGTDGWSGADETQFAFIYTGAWCAVAVALLVVDWQMWRRRDASTRPGDESDVRHAEPTAALKPTA